jgi:dihydrofolate reductase
MTTGHVYIACSLDGFIARPDGGLDWLMADPPGNLMELYATFMADKDGIVMGRKTFETVCGFDPWPYDKPVLVWSRSLTQADIPVALRDKVTTSGADPAQLMGELAARGWRKSYIDGGTTISAFLRAGQIADLVLTRLPCILGDGIPLFSGLPEIQLKHVATDSLDNGAVMSRYAVLGSSGAAP